MKNERTRLLLYCWPLPALAVAGALAYWAMTLGLSSALTADQELGYSVGRGPMSLFGLTAGVLGWFAATLVERRLGVGGPPVWLFGGLICLFSAAAGFALVAATSGVSQNLAMQLALACLIISIVTSGLRTYLPSG